MSGAGHDATYRLLNLDDNLLKNEERVWLTDDVS